MGGSSSGYAASCLPLGLPPRDPESSGKSSSNLARFEPGERWGISVPGGLGVRKDGTGRLVLSVLCMVVTALFRTLPLARRPRRFGNRARIVQVHVGTTGVTGCNRQVALLSSSSSSSSSSAGPTAAAGAGTTTTPTTRARYVQEAIAFVVDSTCVCVLGVWHRH